jgi:ATP-binding cassette subfamily C (CFTR/MRP) protein 1
VSLTSELLRNIRAVKIYAWETFFRKRILDLRRQELRHLQRGGWNRATLTSAMTFLPTMAATRQFHNQNARFADVELVTFVTYYLTGHKLDASKIFAALQLFNVLQTPLSMLPLACFPLPFRH